MVVALPTLSFWGAERAATDFVLNDFSVAGATFFNNMRTPAALLAAAAVKDAFAFSMVAEDVRGKRGWKVLRYGYVLLMICTFCLEISCIFIATNVGVQLSQGGDRMRAISMVALLTREFEYEYVAVRFQFVTGLLAFVCAFALRVRYTLRKLHELSLAMMLIVLACASEMVVYTNARTISYGGYDALAARWFKLHWRMIISEATPSKPIALATALMLAASVFYLLGAFYALLVANADKDQDGAVSLQELNDFIRPYFFGIGFGKRRRDAQNAHQRTRYAGGPDAADALFTAGRV
uniref:EF-hand domain-containing protein n=1 Tax=Coccolithus braarudii TaxID=221442 RepID=A0A7S0Q2C8_9EUKA|mmetsp:Transcript_26770/g.57827  ORF Transcript_26770/g.57827 Transcript_26770/m.57827 type:complete len:295 (+) Transcript_26770:22-906(+)